MLGRPRRGCLGTFDAAIGEAIERFRPGRGGWGAGTIHTELKLSAGLSNLPLPGVRTIHRYLKSRQRTRAYRQVVPLASAPAYPAVCAHDVWQLDAEGNKTVRGLGTVCMINVKDTFSKTYVSTYPWVFAGKSNHPKKEHYQWVLRLGFLEFGLCQRLQVDHESIYYENSHETPFPTPFHLWALGLDIPLCFTPRAKPFRQGAVEREHQTMHRQVCADQNYATQPALFEACQIRRQRLNYHIPCRMLDQKAPLQAFPEAARTSRRYDPRQEEEAFDLWRIYEYLAHGRWIRHITRQKTFSLGAHTYRLPLARPNSEVIITFNLSSKAFQCADADQHQIAEIKPKGLSFKELCGNLEEFIVWATQNHHIQ